MTKVAAAGQLPMSNALHFGHGSDGGGGSKMSTATLKRKTPSELRGELLQRKNPVELVDESPSIAGFTRKSESLRAPRFTRMDKHYPVTKSSKLLSRKEYSKGAFSSKRVDNLETSSFPLDLSAKHVQNSCSEDAAACNDVYDSSDQTNNSTERCTSGTFRSVRELSLGGEKLNDFNPVDMSEALKGLVSCEVHTVSAPDDECINKTRNLVPQRFCAELHIPDRKIPLDLTLKSSMRLLCSSSVHWFHRLTSCATLNVMGLFSQVGCESHNMSSSTTQVTNPGTFYSWVHPQSSLPRVVISALASVPGGQVDFLSKRQQTWEDSFRNLYYMLRKKFCKIFYVCTMQFVVMFTATHGTEKFDCDAYISQSTRTLRSLLKEHDVCFSMPLCYSKVEEVTVEDLVELSVIEKHNLGQTRTVESMTGVDNTPQSLLMFSGNKNVHALYDCLLNYRSVFTSLTGEDVPTLYSPVPFENAAITAPEVRCKQVRKIDSMPSQLKDSNTDSNPNSSSASICYSVEIRDAYLPPWIISGICNTVCSNGVGFQASFTTDPTSIGLNVGLHSVACDKTAQPHKADGESDCNLDIPNTNLSLEKHSAFLKGLKYGDGSYTAFLSPAE